ncbi:MAG: hypothetical protein J3Q66DRAFT_112588 [Benniella sp.]|nr:MAG: hypothetical protein J3Q66DRAFT_112588 [Benniella sp.]
MAFVMAPFAYYFVWNSGLPGNVLATIFLCLISGLENTLVTRNCRAILDSQLAIVEAITAFSYTNFEQNSAPFSDDWFTWLFLTGVGLGWSAFSTQVGTFITSVVGATTIYQTSVRSVDPQCTQRSWWNHFMARAICLFIVPLTVNMMKEVTIANIPKEPTTANISKESTTAKIPKESTTTNSPKKSTTASNPKGSTTANNPKKSFSKVAYGAVITIRHEDTRGYLHSHALNYETGSRQQRVALHNSTHPTYIFNDWVIQKRDGTVPRDLEYVRDGDYIRLLHVASRTTTPHKSRYMYTLFPSSQY